MPVQEQEIWTQAIREADIHPATPEQAFPERITPEQATQERAVPEQVVPQVPPAPLSGAVTRNGRYRRTASLAAGLRFDFQTGFVSIIRSNSSAQDNVSEWGTTRLSVRPSRMQETVS